MAYRWLASLLFLVLTLPAFGAKAPAPRDVVITAPDGAKLKATYYSAGKPGPAVLLLHMCNSQRTAWEPVARQLSAKGIHALAVDYRGFGESEGERYDKLTPQQQGQMVTQKWPGDVDAAFAYLLAQPGVDKARIGAGGGSCGVNQAVQVARRHPEVKSLVLLAGGTNQEGLQYLEQTHWLPVFAAAAADDEFDADAEQTMQWLLALSGNPRNQFEGFTNGRHGTEIFGPHPELPKAIVAWYVETLVKAPAGPNTAVVPRQTAARTFWSALQEPGGIAKAVQVFHDARKHDPHAYVFPQGIGEPDGLRTHAGGADEGCDRAVQAERGSVSEFRQRVRQPGRRLPGRRTEQAGAGGGPQGDRDAPGGQGERGVQEGGAPERRAED